MQLKGQQTFQTTPEKLWSVITDKDKLAAITPGVSTLEEVEVDVYKAIAQISIGPVKGRFTGDLKMIEKKPNESVTMEVTQKSKIGNADVSVTLEIQAVSPTESSLSFKGLAKMSGLLARMGQRVMSGVAQTITKQLFAGIEEELEKLED